MTQEPPPPGPQDRPQDRPYTAPPASPYPPPPPGPPAYQTGPVYGPPAYSPYASNYYAHWGRRVGAYLMDAVFAAPGFVLIMISAVVLVPTDPVTGRSTGQVNPAFPVLLILGYAISLGLNGYNRWYRMGRTGQSWGKKSVGIRLVRASDGRPIGAGLAFARDLCHIVDGLFYLGYLWPLWDPKRQTFADKICSTVVLAH